MQSSEEMKLSGGRRFGPRVFTEASVDSLYYGLAEVGTNIVKAQNLLLRLQDKVIRDKATVDTSKITDGITKAGDAVKNLISLLEEAVKKGDEAKVSDETKVEEGEKEA